MFLVSRWGNKIGPSSTNCELSELLSSNATLARLFTTPVPPILCGWRGIVYLPPKHLWKVQSHKPNKNNTYQCNRSACKKADRPSMMSRMATVRTPKKKKTMVRRKKPPKLLEERPMRITMDHSTSDNSEQEGGRDLRFVFRWKGFRRYGGSDLRAWARLRAQSLR